MTSPGPPDPLYLSWLAGFIDGEGCIRLAVRSRKSKSRTYLHGSVILSVSQAEPRHTVLQELHERFGGRLVKVKASEKSSAWNDAWYWSMCGAECLNLLNLLLPYFRCKKRQAEIAIHYEETKSADSIGVRRGTKRTDLRVNDNVIRQRCELIREMAALNQRGSKKTALIAAVEKVELEMEPA